MSHFSLRSSVSAEHAKKLRRRAGLERLENRNLLTAAAGSMDVPGLLSSGVCNCPVCTGIGLSTSSIEQVSESSTDVASALAGIPALSSNPSAKAKLYLDFDGDFQSDWGTKSNIRTPAFNRDGIATSFSGTELAMMKDIWARVAEDYSPFNIDVTTIAPGSLANKLVAHIAIGGDGSWYASGTGGVAYIGGFNNSASNVGYVFDDNLSSAKSIADACSHEAGHLFGLNHQSLYSGASKIEEYHSGNSAWAPIMGNSYSGARSTWHRGTSTTSSGSFQDDIAIISSSSNGFGLKVDDFGSSIATASQLPGSGTSVSVAGLLGYHTDQDVWKFTTSGGTASFSLDAAQSGPNLDAILEIRSSTGALIASSDASNSLDASISTMLGSGTYYVIARSNGSYGNMGQYTLTGALPAALQTSEISVLAGTTPLASGSTLSFGQVRPGSSVDRTITIRNDGSGKLTLSPINSASLPAGFTLVSNIGNLQLSAGATTQFIVRFASSTPGNYRGVLNLLSDDANERTIGISLTGSVMTSSVTTTSWGAIDFFLSENRTATGDTWFSATSKRAGWFSAEAYFDNNQGNVDVEVYNANKQLLGRSNSLANAERVDVTVAAGQQLFVRIIGTNRNVSYRCTNLVSSRGDTINVYGTTREDLLVMLPGSGTHRVAVNGVGYDFSVASYRKIVVQDAGGTDNLIVVGNDQNETAVVSQSSTVMSGSRYTLTAAGAENVRLLAGGGSDSATFYDRAGNDTYAGHPTEGVLSGAGYQFQASGFDLVRAVFNRGGYDQAKLYGSIGDDRYEASPTSAFLQEESFRHEVSGYDTVVGVGGAGNDIALLHDTADNEIFNGDPTAATLSSASMYVRAEAFDRVEARSSGGFDVANLKDSAGHDLLGASKVLAYLNGVGFSNYVEGFDRVTATSSGGFDTAHLYDSVSDDLLTINGNMRRLESAAYSIQTEGFRAFRAIASLGNDRVTMQQLAAADTIQGRANWTMLSDTDSITGFDQLIAVAKTQQMPKVDVAAIDYLFTKIGW